jgi:CHAT domain-containing protein
LLQKSLSFARQHHDVQLEASDLLNLGFFALQAEHIDEALDAFRLSSQLAGTIHADAMRQADIGNIGWAYFELGDFEQAIDIFREARSDAQRLGATDSEIFWLQGEGLSLSHLGKMKEAQVCYEQALQTAQASRNVRQQAQIETALTLLFLQLGQISIAQQHANAAVLTATQIGNQSTLLDASLTRALVAARLPDTAGAEAMLLQVLHDSSDQPSIRWQVQEGLATLYAAQHRPALAEKWYRDAIQTFEAQRNSVQDTANRLPFLANGNQLYRLYADYLIATQRSTQALNLLDGVRAKTLKEGLSTGSPTSASHAQHSVAKPGDPSSASLFYSLGPDKSNLWVISGQNIHLVSLPSEAEIKTHIESYQSSILKSRDPLQDRNTDAIWLYNTLVAPAEPFIGEASNIIIIPDGPLNGFNMETLVREGPQGLHYWIEDVTLTESSSLRSRENKLSARNSQAPRKLLLIGDPLIATPEYQQLPHAGSEIDDVARYFPEAQRSVFTKSKAIPNAYVIANAAQYDYVHFVAHGVASTLHPLDSAIVLSRPSSDADHFKLYARDIVQNPLHAELVTISACYGSGVRNYAGEGLVGLAWAFLRAGAHQVIAALWDVNDDSTPQLMDQMYSQLAHNVPPAQALRTAKLSLLHSKGVFRKPLYWAAFQIYSGY